MEKAVKYYIATSTSRAPFHHIIRDRLGELGHEITHDWTSHGSVRETTQARLQQVAEADLQGILDADFVLVLLPGGKGTHTELGFSIGSKKWVFVHSEDPKMFEPGPEVCAFYHHPAVIRFSCPIEQVAETIQSMLAASIR